eukprot:4869959-Pleurochrysis_carterae.AAC.1
MFCWTITAALRLTCKSKIVSKIFLFCLLKYRNVYGDDVFFEHLTAECVRNFPLVKRGNTPTARRWRTPGARTRSG